MPIRNAQAEWRGTLKDGQGRMSFGSGAFEGIFSFGSRFEEGQGTNPEELIAAAHAGCFSMSLASGLGKAGFPADRIATRCELHLDKLEAGFRITRIILHTEADVPGIGPATFEQLAEQAKSGCPVSQALAGVPIELEAKLIQ
jgi:osmotically inducible protein OsmC